MKQYIMAIDQGTTSSRAILFDESSNIIATAQKEVDTYYPHPGWVEQNANDIWASVVGVMNEVVARSNISSEQIAAVGITNQRETTVIWEKKSGKPIELVERKRGKSRSPSPLYGSQDRVIIIAGN